MAEITNAPSNKSGCACFFTRNCSGELKDCYLLTCVAKLLFVSTFLKLKKVFEFY